MTRSHRPPTKAPSPWPLLLALLVTACHADTPVSVDVDVDVDHDALHVTTETRGRVADDGYRVEITGPHTHYEDRFEPNDTRRYPVVFDGRYRIELFDVGASCEAERPVHELELEAGEHRSVLFAVSCLES